MPSSTGETSAPSNAPRAIADRPSALPLWRSEHSLGPLRLFLGLVWQVEKTSARRALFWRIRPGFPVRRLPCDGTLRGVTAPSKQREGPRSKVSAPRRTTGAVRSTTRCRRVRSGAVTGFAGGKSKTSGKDEARPLFAEAQPRDVHHRAQERDGRARHRHGCVPPTTSSRVSSSIRGREDRRPRRFGDRRNRAFSPTAPPSTLTLDPPAPSPPQALT